MYTIVGLGNPGTKYEKTRHNIGREMLTYTMEANGFGKMIDSRKYVGRITEGVIEGVEVVFLFPDTYMNNSGSSVKKMITKQEAEKLIVVYDDIDLAIGEVKVSFGRGAGGHNGVASIIQEIGTKDFVRVRVGIASRSLWTGKPRRPKAGAGLTKHVLGSFKKKEEQQLAEVKKRVEEIIKTIITQGVTQAMNRYNPQQST